MRCLSSLHIARGIALAAVLLLVTHGTHAAPHATGDFDGDGGVDDILQRNLHSDAWRYHTLVDDVPEVRALAISADPAWRFVAVGDFNGDGFDDVLLRRYDTLESAWYAVSAHGVQMHPIGLTVNPIYDVLGTGDFDGDGADEVLFRRNRDFGEWLYYDIAGSSAVLRRQLRMTQNLDWDFAAIGDVDGDGRDDVLARHGYRGHWIAYLMNGTSRAMLRRPRITQNPQFTL